MKKPKSKMLTWSKWILALLILTAAISYAFMGSIQSTSFNGKIGGLQISVDSDNDETVSSIAFAFFASAVLITLIRGIVAIYRIRASTKK